MSNKKLHILAVAVASTVLAGTLMAHEGDGGGPTIPGATPELDVIGTFDPGLFGENITDVWAHTHANGDFAYLGTFDDIACTLDTTGIRIVDISNPGTVASPATFEQVAFVNSPAGSRANDVKVAHLETPHFTGDIMVFTDEPCGSTFVPRLQSKGGGGGPQRGGIEIFDVTDPTKPKSLKRNFLKNGIHNTFIWQDGSNAYLIAVDDVDARDVIVIDITRPQSPKVIAQVGWPDWPADIADEFEAPAMFLHDLWVQGGVAYLSYWDAGLVLLDVNDPANPVFMGDSEYAVPDRLSGEFPAGDGHVSVPNHDGSLVLFGDEDFSAGALVSFTFEDTEFPVAEGGFTPPTFTLPGVMVEGPIHWTGGEGCTRDEIDRIADSSDEIALMQRGSCFFSEKAASAQAMGYAGFIVANDAARGDGLITMSSGTNDVITIPGYFVGNSTGEIMKAAEGGTVVAEGVFDGYGYLRVMNVEHPANITEVGQFATAGVFADPTVFPGDRTMHNIVVDEGHHAYISWYAEGMRVVDFSSCEPPATVCNPIEIAHYIEDSGSNFWGVYLHTYADGKRVILGSDRKTGLWMFSDPVSTGAHQD
jgi:hypothetical protein